jgi:hypothetical protein
MQPVRTKHMRLMVLVGLGACGGGMDGPADDEPVNCAAETRDDDFAVGLQKTGDGGTLGFTLMTAEPAPPQRGDNAWVIQINQMAAGVIGAPVDGADITVSPFMPDHGHPAAKTVIIEPTGNPGEYEMSPINLWMPGLWETTIDATSAGGDDVVVFRFCIPS